MPRFYFNVRDGYNIADADGVELADFRAARREAISLSGALLEDEADQYDISEEDWRLEVTDETGLILFILTFSIMQSPAVPLLRTEGKAHLR